jgi:two-component system, cell cycle sensor histidine kinase and response regulator CckA
MIPDSRGERILLAEDDDALRRMAARALRTSGYDVIEAANGEEALECWDRHPQRIDMLVTDVAMPKIGGLELARLVRQRNAAIRVIYMSGYSQASIATPAELQPDASWISKPFSLRDFLLTIRISLEAAPAMALSL